MQNTNAILHRTTTANPQKHIVMIGIVAAIHVAAIYALVVGLIPKSIIDIPRIIDVIPVTPEVPPPPAPVPTPTMEQPVVPLATAPDVPIANDDFNHTIKVVLGDPRPVSVTPPTAAFGIGSTHTIPPYPEMSIRMQEQGTVTLRLDIAADGTVRDAAVVTSSGSDRLDQAAVAWVKSHWRYKAATRDGAPVATTSLAAVRFNLRDAR